MGIKNIVKESDLYKPLKKHLENMGYTVYGEVKSCDVVAVKDDETIVVEMKLALNLTAIYQALDRQKITEKVYIAVQKPKNKSHRQIQKAKKLLSRLGIGFITIKLPDEVVVQLEPSGYTKTVAKKRSEIKREIDGRSVDINVGGSTHTKIMTAYKETSLKICCVMERMEAPVTPRQLRELGFDDNVNTVLRANFSNWFVRVGHGMYELSEEGKMALNNEEYKVIVDNYKNELDKILKEKNKGLLE